MMPSTLSCGNCGAANQSQAAYCRSCGHSLQAVKPTIYNSATGRLLANILLKQRYLIIAPAGKGGMGAVYKVEDTQLGNRQVALKQMSQSGLNPQEQKETADAFRHEALMLARLQHPNLPNIFDHFEENGRWYLVMSFIEGETLADYLSHAQSGKLPLDEALQIGMHLSTVLDTLHNRQPAIIFRDLKPANIMRAPDGHIYLIDFGIARHFKPGQDKDTAYYGSMGYAPPEQYGKAQTTPRSDIYSLGVVLYQLLSGHDPSSSPFHFPLLQSLVPTVPTNLATLITQMLELDEDKRPANMAAVKQELERHPPIPPTRPALPPPHVPQKKGVTRRNVIIGLIGLVVVGVIVLAATRPSTPSATWLVTFDKSENATQTNGYQVTDPVNYHFIVVHFTFTNNTSQAQELQTGQYIYLQGSDGKRYFENQASNPSNVLQFAPGETQHDVDTAYVVPDSVCNYTLVVANPGGQDLTWSITVTDSNYCHA